MKIVLMGYSGSGKSTLARTLGQRLQLPVLHLDAVHWTAGWKGRPVEQSREMVAQFLAQNPAWIIDGHYSKLHLEQRLQEADMILLLQLPRLACLYRVLRRKLTYKNTVRPDMGAGCPEKLDWAFVKWVLWDDRIKSRAGFYADLSRRYPGKVTVLTGQKQIDRWLRDFTGEK